MKKFKTTLTILALGAIAVATFGCYTEGTGYGTRIYEPAGADFGFYYQSGYPYYGTPYYSQRYYYDNNRYWYNNYNGRHHNNYNYRSYNNKSYRH